MLTRKQQTTKLEAALKALEAVRERTEEPGLMSQCIYGEVKIHAELERIRLGDEKAQALARKLGDDDADPEIVEQRAIEFLKSRGWKVSKA